MEDPADEVSGEGTAAFRALQSAAREVESLRRGDVDPGSARGHVLRVANAVDRSLRRMLRDDEGADITVRLQALAPDELRIDSVLAELRRNERLPMESAAAVHELLEIRRRLEGGAEPSEADRSRAVVVADLVARQAVQPTAAPSPTQPPPAYDEEVTQFEPLPARRGRLAAPIPAWVLGAVVVILLVAIGVWAAGRGGPSEMDTGIALFEAGEYAEAANHFWRYAEQNPRDATPHLYLARIHRRMGRPELAADAIAQAQRIAPEDPAVHRELGFLLLDTGNAQVAVQRFRAAITLDEESTEGWVGLVRALRESGQMEEAERAIEEAPAEARALLGGSGPG